MNKRTYGNLSFISTKTGWEITNIEPHVAIRLKQLFPRIPKAQTNKFQFPNDPITAADLDWFTTRYPLSMTKPDKRKLKKGSRSFEKNQAEMESILLPDYVPPKQAGLREGQVIRHYQAQAVEIIRRRKGLLLGDEGGLGKTFVSAYLMCSEPLSLPAAVVCDSHMQMQWKDKLESFTTLRVVIIKTTRPHDLPDADVYIFRVSQLAGWADIFATGFFNSVTFDEPQSLRTGTGTAKGTAAKVLSDNTTYHLGLTATPIYNYGDEMFNIMNYIDDSILGNWTDFTREWCTMTGNGKYRISNPKALGTYLREQFAMLRRLKSDVDLQLPTVSRIIEHVDYDSKTVKSMDELAKVLAIRATTGAPLERGRAARELDIMVRHSTGVSKARTVANFVKILIEAGEPVILAGWHRDVYDIWRKEFEKNNPAWYTGSESPTKKEQEKMRFINGETDLIIISLRSGAGLDGLQHRCSSIIFGELDWSPAVHQQLIWRIDREGQTQPVSAFFLVTDEGSDPPMMEVNGIKASEATQIVDPHLGVQIVNTNQSNLKKLALRYLSNKNDNTKVKKVA